MNKFQKAAYREAKEIANEYEISWIEDASPTSVVNGCTIAYRPAINSPDCRMIQVAVAYCAPEDEFKKKIGRTLATHKLVYGEFVNVPFGHLYMNFQTEDLEQKLWEMFCFNMA